MEEKVKRYITRDALTSGIKIAHGILEGDTFLVKWRGKMDEAYEKYNRGEHHATVEEARVDCERQRARRVEKLRTQIVKLEQMTFEVPE